MFDFLLSKPQIQKADYEDVLYAIKNPDSCLIINTLPLGEHRVLIKGTIPPIDEEATINSIIADYSMDTKTIVIYGKNANDETVEKKYRQIRSLGFYQVFIYGGGLFEWLLLQDIFGDTNFPTIGKSDNFLRYKPKSAISRVIYKTLGY